VQNFVLTFNFILLIILAQNCIGLHPLSVTQVINLNSLLVNVCDHLPSAIRSNHLKLSSKL
jgi:hypothetical protein